MRCRRIVNGDVVWFGAIPEQIPPQKSLEKTTWDELEAICHRGLHTSYFKVGDKKTVNINGQDYTFVIADFDRYDIIGKDKKACITFMMENVYQDDLQMNTKSQIKEIDLTQAYNTRVTANGLSVVDEAPTTVHRIAGETKASDNLLNLADNIITAEKNGVTVTADNNNKLTFSGTPTGIYFSYLKANISLDSFVGKTLTFSQHPYFSASNSSGAIYWQVYKDGSPAGHTANGTGTLTITIEEGSTYSVVVWHGGSTDAVNETISFMVNEGSTALPYSDYYPGLKSASFKGVTSVGKNLINQQNILDSTRFAYLQESDLIKRIGTAGANGTVVLETALVPDTYTACMEFIGNAPTSKTSLNVYSNGANIGTIVNSSSIVTNKIYSKSFTSTYPDIQIKNWGAYSDYSFRIWIVRGNSAVPYEKYIEDTSFQLSAARQLRKWDYIDVDNQQIVTGTAEVTQKTAFTDEELATYPAGYILSANRKTIAYPLETPTTVPLTVPQTYTAWRDGTETIVIDASQKQNPKGLEVTIDQTYSVLSFGWQPSDIRETTLPMLFETLDQHLQHAIETVGIESYAGDELVKTYDKLFIPATFEIENLRGTDKQFAYYRSIKPGSVAVNRIRYLNNVAQVWWTRDSSQIETQMAYLTNGNRSSISTSQTAKIPICFCVGERQSVYTQFFNENDKHDNYANKQQAVADSLTQRLSVIKSELWYNVYYGLPLLDKLQTKFPLDAFVTKTVQSHPDVVSIKSFTSKVVDHQYTCSMTIQSKYGEIQLNI